MDLKQRASKLADLSPRGVLGTAADVIAVFTIIFGGLVLVLHGPFPQGFLAIAISLLALTFIAISFRLQKRLDVAKSEVARSVQMGRAMPKLAEATGNLARATLAAGDSPDGFQLHTEKAVGVLAEMFQVATAHPCRVTVLAAYAPGDSKRVAVKRLCSSAPDDGRRAGPGQIDWVDENSDFYDIMNLGKRYFFCNDLPREISDGYKNSHWPHNAIPEMRKKNSWPHRSTIVWPVRGYRVDAQDGQWQVIGFLCVDSEAAEVFDQDLDVAPGETFANALYLGMVANQARLDRLTVPDDEDAK